MVKYATSAKQMPEGLIALRKEIGKPIRLELHLDHVDIKYPETRYMKVYIGESLVTGMIANLTGLGLSESKKYYGDITVKGGGSDMGEWLQHRAYEHACRLGYPDMFDMTEYIYRE